MSGIVPINQQLTAPLSRQNINVADRNTGIRRDRGKQTLKAQGQLLNACLIEEIARKLDTARNPERPAIRIRCSARLNDKSNLAVAVPIRSGRTVRPGRLKLHAHCSGRPAPPGTEDAGSSSAAGSKPQQAARTEDPGAHRPPDPYCEHAPADPRSSVARSIGTQYQRVDEEAPEVVKRVIRATGYRTAKRNVRPRPQSRQEARKARLRHHEQARLSPARQFRSCRCRIASRWNGTLPPRWLATAPEAIVGRVQFVRQTSQGLLPMGQLARNRTAGVRLLAKKLLLPEA